MCSLLFQHFSVKMQGHNNHFLVLIIFFFQIINRVNSWNTKDGLQKRLFTRGIFCNVLYFLSKKNYDLSISSRLIEQMSCQIHSVICGDFKASVSESSCHFLQYPSMQTSNIHKFRLRGGYVYMFAKTQVLKEQPQVWIFSRLKSRFLLLSQQQAKQHFLRSGLEGPFIFFRAHGRTMNY